MTLTDFMTDSLLVYFEHVHLVYDMQRVGTDVKNKHLNMYNVHHNFIFTHSLFINSRFLATCSGYWIWWGTGHH